MDVGLNCSSNRSIIINWSAPHSLDISQNDNDIHYTVVVGNYPSCLSKSNEINTTYTTIMAPLPANSSICNSYQVEVSPYNIAGYGNTTMTVKMALNEGKKNYLLIINWNTIRKNERIILSN